MMTEHTKDLLDFFYKGFWTINSTNGRASAHEFVLSALKHEKEKAILETKVEMLTKQVEYLVSLKSPPRTVLAQANDLVKLSNSGVLPPVPAECVGKISALGDEQKEGE